MEYLLLIFATSFFVVLLSTPSLIKVAILKRLVDTPGEQRKLHKRIVPTIGGIIIFAGTLFAFSLWFPMNKLPDEIMAKEVETFKYLVATLLLLFFVGVKDDIIGTAAIKKLAAHVIVGLILVLMADIRLTSLHGIFGVREIPYWGSVFLSLFTYIVVVNAFNLIDGVDGLAAGVGFISCIAFGLWFYFAGDLAMASLAFAMAGSLLAFLNFNYSPARIFMGDSGSLTIGLVLCVLAIRLIEFDKQQLNIQLEGISKPIFVMAVLAYPLVDTLRIFFFRAIKGVSPFTADRNHLHHRLLDIGLGHRRVTTVIYSASIILIVMSVSIQGIDPNISLAIIGGTALLLAQVPFFIKKVQDNNKHNNDDDTNIKHIYGDRGVEEAKKNDRVNGL